ncbi:MAG: PP2C family protein-serine/threonine phosphatase [Phycisphaerae bacterium]
MIRETCDVAWLEDFLNGIAPHEPVCHLAFDSRGMFYAGSDASSLGLHAEQILPKFAKTLHFERLQPALEPPAEIGVLEHHGLWFVLAPIHVDTAIAGYAAVGPFRQKQLQPEQAAIWAPLIAPPITTPDDLWFRLQPLERRGDWPAIRRVRWLARMLADWSRREVQIVSATEELSLLGDIAELMLKEHDVQKILDHIVAETANVMKCRFCTLRLLDADSGELRLAAVHNLSERYLKKGLIFKGDNPIDREAMAGKIVYVEDAAADPRIKYNAEMRKEGIVSGLIAGLIHRGESVGVIRVYTDHKQRFRGAQKKMLRAVATQAAAAIVNARLFEERAAANKTQRALELAGDLQTRMMRTRPPMKEKIRTAVIFEPSYEVGGDYCDFVPLADGRQAVVAADVVGKQVKASLLATYLRGALRATAETCSDVADLVTRLNVQLCNDTLPSEFVTLLLVAISDDGRQLDYCNAGHEPLLVARGDEVLVSEVAGLVLGVDGSETYTTRTFALEPGDTCLLYTDGAIEAVNYKGEMFGRERLQKAFHLYRELEIGTMLKSIHWDIRRFAGLAEQVDDLTLVGVRVLD